MEKIIDAMVAHGMSKRRALRILKEASEVSVSTGAEMLNEYGVKLEDAYAFLRTSPKINAPGIFSAERFLKVVFVSLGLVLAVLDLIRFFRFGPFAISLSHVMWMLIGLSSKKWTERSSARPLRTAKVFPCSGGL